MHPVGPVIAPRGFAEPMVEPEAVDNPLREARLNDSRDFRPEWDVAALNAWVSKALLQDIDRISRAAREPGPRADDPRAALARRIWEDASLRPPGV